MNPRLRLAKSMTWRRHLNFKNISALLIIAGVIIVGVSIVLFGYNLDLAGEEKKEQLWKDDVNKLIRDAKKADDTWIMIPHLTSANQVLIDHDYESTLDEFIERAEEIENHVDYREYRKGLYLLKQDLDEWPALVQTSEHVGGVTFWFGCLFGGFGIVWIGWEGISREDC